MKKLLTLLLVFTSCNSNTDNLNTYNSSRNELLRAVWSRAWISGANAVIDAQNEGLYSTKYLELQRLKDSIFFNKIITK